MKTCARCSVSKPLDAFARRAKSADGLTASCRDCINAYKRTLYALCPIERSNKVMRVFAAKQARFKREPGYKRAFNIWGSAKTRTTVPPWVKITDFVPLCTEAVRRGPKCVVDHIVPLIHPDVCGLHVVWNCRLVSHQANQRKGNRFDPQSVDNVASIEVRS